MVLLQHLEDSYKSDFGIGMCIVKSIIDESDIDLYIDSELGTGSQFSYVFHASMIVKMKDQKDGLHLQSLEKRYSLFYL